LSTQQPTFNQPTWGLGPFHKYDGNPILQPGGEPWEAHALYNPAAWTDGNVVYLVYRAEGPCDFPGRAFTSRIGLARSGDGRRFERMHAPILSPTETYEIPGGCEDPRVVKIGDSFVMTYTAYDGSVARLALARSDDLLHWTKLGLAFSDEQWDAYFPHDAFPNTPRGWSKSGALLAEPIDGRFWMYFGDTCIWAAHSSDLTNWEIRPEPVLAPRAGHFDAGLVEPGPPPIMLDGAIWLGYNSADTSLRYAFGQALIDARDPTRVLRRSDTPLLEPTVAAEIVGQVPQVVFAEGLVRFHEEWLLYYGMADSRLGLAICST
jgi:predicted GH43/DUF377 family glycosyl hydrolase